MAYMTTRKTGLQELNIKMDKRKSFCNNERINWPKR